MKNILNSDELFSLDTNLAPAKGSIILSLCMFIIGVTAAFFGTQMNALEYVNYTLAIGGCVIAVIALGNICITPREIVNIKTNELLHKHKLYFNADDSRDVEEHLRNGGLQALLDKSRDSGQFLAIIYSTTNKHYYIAQLFKFVPYEYRPCSEPVVYTA